MALVKETETVAPEATTETETETVDQAVVETPTKEVAVKEPAGELVDADSDSYTKMEVVQGIFLQSPAVMEIVNEMGFGDFPVIKVAAGTAACGDDELGKTFRITAHAAVKKFSLSPGSDEPEAKDYFNIYYPGAEFCERGEGLTKDEAIQECKDDGYKKAEWKDYIDLVCTVVECEGMPSYEDEQVVIQMSPASIFGWKKAIQRIRMKAAMGKHKGDGAPIIEVTVSNGKTKAGKTYPRFEFSLGE